jgi:nitrate/nitrite transport system ATP-binding protein
MALIELRNISKTYQTDKAARHVLSDVNLSVEEGEFVSVVGYSASGKTTLMKILSGLLRPTSGDVLINGKAISGISNEAAVVFQNYSLLPWFSALENVRLAVEAAFPTRTRAQQTTQAARYLDMVGLGKAMEKRPTQLSGGMRQRVAIARAFATEPRILFLDEPFGALDALTRTTLQQELGRLCSEAARSVTAIMITNSVDEAILLSDRIVPMSRAPKAMLGPGIMVSLPKPRLRAALLHDEGALRIHSHVVEFLTGFTHSVNRPSDALKATGRPTGIAEQINAEVQI